MPINEVTVLYSLIAFLFGLLVKSFFPNYIKKKAENLATKEDIEAITTKIESVKSAIALNADAHKSYISERKNYLISFYDDISEFNYEYMAVNFGDFPFDSGKSLYEYQQNVYKSVAEIVKAYQRLVIYMPRDSKILSISHDITNNVIESRSVIKSKFGSIKTTVIEEEEAYKEYKLLGSVDKSRYEAAVESADKANSEYWEQMKPLADMFRIKYQEYLTELNYYLAESEINA
ncbi:hypothetical protein [uncultured Desulfuromonas sp.]|uniref:hypothetical protein n=1 Tax=uncultured Desulfuromonas sp. TaxID=181013 RepID=UPI002AAB26B9|nr:hypothetical protein [uncultured Desulfuromonas sp.]